MDRLSSDEVIAKIMEHAPDLASHMQLDRAWVWYCGPALTGKHNEGKRAALKAAGFRFAPKGREVNGRMGHWAHSCQAPMPRYRNSKQPARAGGTGNEDEAMALLEML